MPDVGSDLNDEGTAKIEIRVFLQLCKPRAVTALQKLLSPFVPDLSGNWEHGPQPARENDRERFELLGIIDTI